MKTMERDAQAAIVATTAAKPQSCTVIIVE
jgi:hypothetical protein